MRTGGRVVSIPLWVVALVGGTAAVWLFLFVLSWFGVVPSLTPHSAGATASTPALSPSPANAVGARVGVQWRDGKGAVTINEARWLPDAENVEPTYGAFLAIDITYEVTAGTIVYNPLYWRAKDADAREYITTRSVSAASPVLQSGDLSVGEKVRGWLTFDVPKGTTTITLDDVMSGGLAAWTIQP